MPESASDRRSHGGRVPLPRDVARMTTTIRRVAAAITASWRDGGLAWVLGIPFALLAMVSAVCLVLKP